MMSRNAERILKDMRDKGYRITVARRSVLDILIGHKDPISVPEILAHLKDKDIKVNKVTVYRELDVLKEENIVSEIIFGDGKKRYELAHGEHHHHLICIKCNNVEDVVLAPDLGLEAEEKKIEKDNDFKVLRHSLEFFGLCSNCK